MQPTNCIRVLLVKQCGKNYTTIEREAMAMNGVCSSQICHYLFSNKFIFYVDHMALLYLVKRPQVYGQIVQWLLLFLKYKFLVVYKPQKSQLITDVLSYLLAFNEPSGVPYQVTDAPLFLF